MLETVPDELSLRRTLPKSVGGVAGIDGGEKSEKSMLSGIQTHPQVDLVNPGIHKPTGNSINASEAAEAGIVGAIKTPREKAWREENKKWIAAHNERVAREGVLLPVRWM